MAHPANVFTNTIISTASGANPGDYFTIDSEGNFVWVEIPELPIDAMQYKGAWDASTNTPTLIDGTGTTGDFYRVSVAGTQDLGGGPISYEVNDALIYNGTVWQHFTHGAGGVLTVTGNAVDNTDPENPVIDNYIFGQTFWVHPDAPTGTGVEGTFNKPFKTLKQAIDVANSTLDTIIMFAGQYEEGDNNCWKDGVSIKAFGGAVEIINVTFNDAGLAGKMSISGDILIQGSGASPIFTITQSLSELYVDITKIENDGNTIFDLSNGLTHYVDIDFIVCYNASNLLYENCDVELNFRDFDGSTVGTLWEHKGNKDVPSSIKVKGNLAISSTIIHRFSVASNTTAKQDIFVQVAESYTTGGSQCVQLADGSPLSAGLANVTFKNCYIEGNRTNRGSVYMLGGNVGPYPGVRNLTTWENCTIRNTANFYAYQYGSSRYNNTKFIDCVMLTPTGIASFNDSGTGQSSNVDVEVQGTLWHNSTVGFSNNSGGRLTNILGSPSASVEQDLTL